MALLRLVRRQIERQVDFLGELSVLRCGFDLLDTRLHWRVGNKGIKFVDEEEFTRITKMHFDAQLTLVGC